MYLPYATTIHSLSTSIERKLTTHVRAFLTSEGGGWSGRSVMTEGLVYVEPGGHSMSSTPLTLGALTATRALPERVRAASIFALSEDDGGERCKAET